MHLKSLLRQNKNALLYLLTTLVLPISVSSYAGIYLISHEQMFLSFGLQEWTLVFLITSFTMALALTPTTFVALTSGYFLGFACIPGLILSYTFASFLGYTIAKNIGGAALKTSLIVEPKLKLIVNGLHDYENSIIFLTRISPILPFALINGVLGILACNIQKFIIIGTLGMLPRTLLFIFVGKEVNNIIMLFKSGKSMSIAQYSFYVLLGISIIGILWVMKAIAQQIKEKINRY
jgi:uncharacterized membrane protein YdjX (TVP38/TMEM64 family)